MRLMIRLHLDEHLSVLPLHGWDVTVYDAAGEREATWTALAGPFDTVEEATAAAVTQARRYLEGRGHQDPLPLASPPS